jgi:large subunit ribosomal protein L25
MIGFTLNGSIRDELGSANTNRLRKAGFIPAVIYGDKGAKNTFISIVKKDFNKEYLRGGITTRIIDIDIDGKKQKVLTYQLELDPLTDLPRHVDFINIEGKKEIKTKVPVKYIDKEKSPGVKKGGYLNILKRNIYLFVEPNNIPDRIEVNVAMLHIGANIKINDIELPKNVHPVEKTNYVLCSVTGRGKSDVEDKRATAENATTTATADAKATDTKNNEKSNEKK